MKYFNVSILLILTTTSNFMICAESDFMVCSQPDCDESDTPPIRLTLEEINEIRNNQKQARFYSKRKCPVYYDKIGTKFASRTFWEEDCEHFAGGTKKEDEEYIKDKTRQKITSDMLVEQLANLKVAGKFSFEIALLRSERGIEGVKKTTETKATIWTEIHEKVSELDNLKNEIKKIEQEKYDQSTKELDEYFLKMHNELAQEHDHISEQFSSKKHQQKMEVFNTKCKKQLTELNPGFYGFLSRSFRRASKLID